MKKLLLSLIICSVILSSVGCSKSHSSKESDNNSNSSQSVMSKDKSEEKPEIKPEIKPKEKPKTKPETKPETKTDIKTETKPKTKPTTKPDPKPDPKPETKPQPKPDPKPETKPETKPDPKPGDNIINGELNNIIEKIYSISKLELPRTSLTKVTTENSKYYLGTNNIEYVEALASEPLIGSYPHSLVLLRAKDGSNINKIKEDIKNNIDPRKWICVSVEPENVVVDNIGNLIILILDNRSEKFHEAFLSLRK